MFSMYELGFSNPSFFFGERKREGKERERAKDRDFNVVCVSVWFGCLKLEVLWFLRGFLLQACSNVEGVRENRLNHCHMLVIFLLGDDSHITIIVGKKIFFIAAHPNKCASNAFIIFVQNYLNVPPRYVKVQLC